MFRHHRTALAIALTTALAAAAPASARLDLNPPPTVAGTSTPTSTNLCSEVCSGHGYTAGTSAPAASAEIGARLPHNPRAGGQLSSSVNATVPVTHGILAGPRSEVVSGGGDGTPSAAPTIVRVVAPANGFDWGDAGIGAGGAVAVIFLLAGGIVAVPSIRHRATRAAAHDLT